MPCQKKKKSRYFDMNITYILFSLLLRYIHDAIFDVDEDEDNITEMCKKIHITCVCVCMYVRIQEQKKNRKKKHQNPPVSYLYVYMYSSKKKSEARKKKIVQQTEPFFYYLSYKRRAHVCTYRDIQ